MYVHIRIIPVWLPDRPFHEFQNQVKFACLLFLSVRAVWVAGAQASMYQNISNDPTDPISTDELQNQSHDIP